jgi:hypothetical protein
VDDRVILISDGEEVFVVVVVGLMIEDVGVTLEARVVSSILMAGGVDMRMRCVERGKRI